MTQIKASAHSIFLLFCSRDVFFYKNLAFLTSFWNEMEFDEEKLLNSSGAQGESCREEQFEEKQSVYKL